MAWFFSAMTGKSTWQTLNVQDREAYVTQHKPEFMTILDCNAMWAKNEAPPQDLAYRGPFYLDWDSHDDIDTVLEDVRTFMDKLEGMKFDLKQASWWLSGRKGVHCTIPMACFYTEKPNGVADLPDIYRKLAWEYITPSLDMRVYTARRGRMWRTTYRPRHLDDGRITWKVPIHPEQLRNLDEAKYWEWCAEERPAIRPEDPQMNAQLRAAFLVAIEDLKTKKKSKSTTKSFSFASLEEVPTIQAAFKGEAILDDCNLNDIKLQLATAAVAVGYNSLDDENAYIEAIKGFIEHRSHLKGVTHNNKIMIENAMREAFRYVAENNYFIYSPAGFRTILSDDFKINVDYLGVNQEDPESTSKFIESMAGNMSVNKLGVIQINNKTMEVVSNYFWKPGSLKVIRDDVGRVSHYSVIPIISSKEKSRQELPRIVISLADLNSQTKFSLHIQSYGGQILGLNAKESSRFRQALLNFVGSADNKFMEMKASGLEGLYIEVVNEKGEDDKQEIFYNRYWVESDTTHEGKIEKSDTVGLPFYIDAANAAGIFKTDLFHCTSQSTEKFKETVSHILDLNGNTYSLAIVLGWFSACFIKHILYTLNLIKNFPLLQVVGQAGSGKTTTINLMLNLFSFQNKINVLAANNTSRYAIEKRLVSSASIPVVVDEVKAQNVSSQWMQDFRGLLQVAYTIGSTVSKGGGNSAGSHYAELSHQPMLAPIAWLGESLDTSQTSLLERLVPAMFHLDDKTGRSEHVKFLSRNEDCISFLGYKLAKQALNCDLNALQNHYLKIEAEVSSLLYNGSNDRIVSNAIAVTAGYDFFCQTLMDNFGDVFEDKLKAMRSALLNKAFWTTSVASEVVMFMKNMSNASRELDISAGKLIIDQHYRFIAGDGGSGRVNFLIVSAPRLFYIYRKRCKATGIQPVYSSETELFSVLKNSSFAVDSFMDNVLQSDCVQMDVERLEAAGVPNFSTK